MYTSGLYHKSEVNMTNNFIEKRVEELEKATTEQIEWNRGQIDTNGLVISKLSEVFDKVAKQGEEIAELKLIVHQLRVPSTIVEDVIEFEGQQYKKVDRMAREGDVVVFHHKGHEYSSVKTNKPYLVNRVHEGHLAHYDGITTNPCSFRIYDWGRNENNVDVYELIVEDKTKIQGIAIEIEAPKSPNQQRAEVIAKAKKFIDKHDKGFNIHTNSDNRMIAYNIKTEQVGFAKCMPTDVFNEHIGKAIALGRALRLDVSEFVDAVQPDEIVSGMYCKHRLPNYEGKVTHFDGSQWRGEKGIDGSAPHNLTIINDTNAKYEVNA